MIEIRSNIYVGLYVKYRLFLTALIKPEFCPKIFPKTFHEKPPSWSWVIANGQTWCR